MVEKKSGATIQVRVKLFGHLKQIAQQANLVKEVQAGATVFDLIQEISRQLGDDFQDAILDKSGNLHGGIEIVLNKDHVPARKINNIYLQKDSEIFIMPMIEGGSSQSNLLANNTILRGEHDYEWIYKQITKD